MQKCPAQTRPLQYTGAAKSCERSIVVDYGVTHIGGQSFQFLSTAKTATIAESVDSIGCAAFWYCTHLKDVCYEGSWSDWDNIKIDLDNRCLTAANFHFNSQMP